MAHIMKNHMENQAEITVVFGYLGAIQGAP